MTSDSFASHHDTGTNPDDASFRIGPCGDCDSEVLTARDLDSEGRLDDLCFHCGASVPQTRWVAAAAVHRLGYFVEGLDESASEGRGCRGGACGVQQPEESSR